MSSKISSEAPFRPLRLVGLWAVSLIVAYILGASGVTLDSIGIHLVPQPPSTAPTAQH